MTVIYKLTKIEPNRPEVSVELSDIEVESIYEAMDLFIDWDDTSEHYALSVQDKISELNSK